MTAIMMIMNFTIATNDADYDMIDDNDEGGVDALNT